MRTVLFAMCVCMGVAAGEARGAVPGLDFTGGGGYVAGTFQNEGWAFDVSTPITVTGLAVFDYASDGFMQSHEAGLWNSDGTVLLASVTVTSSDPLTASSALFGGWRTAAIGPVVLGPGEYVVSANYPNTGDIATEDPFFALGAASNGGTITTVPGVTWVETRFTHFPVTGFAYPDQVAAPGTQFDRGFFGADIVVATPLPRGGLAALGVLGVAGVGVGLRRGRRGGAAN
jgi:hypothetical protein